MEVDVGVQGKEQASSEPKGLSSSSPGQDASKGGDKKIEGDKPGAGETAGGALAGKDDAAGGGGGVDQAGTGTSSSGNKRPRNDAAGDNGAEDGKKEQSGGSNDSKSPVKRESNTVVLAAIPEKAPRLEPLARLKAVYFHDPELSVFEHGREHVFRPFRAKLAHALLCSYGYYPNFLEPLHPRVATRTDLGQFHSDAYLEVLATAQITCGHEFSWFGSRRGKSSEKEASKSYPQSLQNVLADKNSNAAGGDKTKTDKKSDSQAMGVFKRFNVFLSSDQSPNAVFPGVMDYCRMVTTGSLGCAARLCSGDANLAINWYGGMSHARSSSAHLGCYVNDTVLSILELLQHFPRVLYINLSGIHSDAVEQAFYSTPRVLTISFHVKATPGKNEFPGTGDVADTGVAEGDGFSVNVPLDEGIDDLSFVPMFRSIMNKARQVYHPNAVVMQCGGSLLAGERDSRFNLTCRGYGDCLRLVRDFGLPMLLLGGVGGNLAHVSRLWAYLTTVTLGLEASLPNRIPEDMPEYRDYFAPTYETVVPRAEVPRDLHDPKLIPNLRRKVMNNLDRLKHKILAPI